MNNIIKPDDLVGENSESYSWFERNFRKQRIAQKEEKKVELIKTLQQEKLDEIKIIEQRLQLGMSTLNTDFAPQFDIPRLQELRHQLHQAHDAEEDFFERFIRDILLKIIYPIVTALRVNGTLKDDHPLCQFIDKWSQWGNDNFYADSAYFNQELKALESQLNDSRLKKVSEIIGKQREESSTELFTQHKKIYIDSLMSAYTTLLEKQRAFDMQITPEQAKQHFQEILESHDWIAMNKPVSTRYEADLVREQIINYKELYENARQELENTYITVKALWMDAYEYGVEEELEITQPIADRLQKIIDQNTIVREYNSSDTELQQALEELTKHSGKININIEELNIHVSALDSRRIGLQYLEEKLPNSVSKLATIILNKPTDESFTTFTTKVSIWSKDWYKHFPQGEKRHKQRTNRVMALHNARGKDYLLKEQIGKIEDLQKQRRLEKHTKYRDDMYVRLQNEKKGIEDELSIKEKNHLIDLQKRLADGLSAEDLSIDINIRAKVINEAKSKYENLKKDPAFCKDVNTKLISNYSAYSEERYLLNQGRLDLDEEKVEETSKELAQFQWNNKSSGIFEYKITLKHQQSIIDRIEKTYANDPEGKIEAIKKLKACKLLKKETEKGEGNIVEIGGKKFSKLRPKVNNKDVFAGEEGKGYEHEIYVKGTAITREVEKAGKKLFKSVKEAKAFLAQYIPGATDSERIQNFVELLGLEKSGYRDDFNVDWFNQGERSNAWLAEPGGNKAGYLEFSVSGDGPDGIRQLTLGYSFPVVCFED